MSGYCSFHELKYSLEDWPDRCPFCEFGMPGRYSYITITGNLNLPSLKSGMFVFRSNGWELELSAVNLNWMRCLIWRAMGIPVRRV